MVSMGCAASLRSVLLAATCAVVTNAYAVTPYTPEKGGGWVSLAYDYIHMQNHLDPDGKAADIGSMNHQSLGLSGEYGVTDHFAIYGGLPYVQAQYTGSHPHILTTPDGVPHVSQTDDGSYHGSFQDVSIGAKYGMSIGRWAVSPGIEYGRPTHDYPDFTHAAIGGNETSTSLGLAAGRFLPEPLDRFYLEFGYLYTFLEQFQGTSVTTSTGLVETDFFATDRLMLRLYAVGVKTHNGLGPADFRGNPDLFEHHEQLGRIDSISVAGGASYLLSATVSVFSSVSTMTWGENVHEVKYDVRVGISRAF
jgi:hypothetical protein